MRLIEAAHDLCDSVHPFRSIVEGRYHPELNSTCLEEQLSPANRNLFQSFQAIDREGGAHDRKPANTGTREAPELDMRVRLEPAIRTKPQLIGDTRAVLRPARAS